MTKIQIQRNFSQSGPSYGSPGTAATGFTLVEMLIALLVLSFGLIATGQLMYVAMSSASLARSKGNAAIAAQSKLQVLADLYRQNESASDLTLGNHGPEQVQVQNSSDGTTLNLFRVTWIVAMVPDPRPGKVLGARMVTVTVTPIDAAGNDNLQTALNKVVSISAIFSPRIS